MKAQVHQLVLVPLRELEAGRKLGSVRAELVWLREGGSDGKYESRLFHFLTPAAAAPKEKLSFRRTN